MRNWHWFLKKTELANRDTDPLYIFSAYVYGQANVLWCVYKRRQQMWCLVVYPFLRDYKETAIYSYSAISRKTVGKNLHATMPKGDMGYDQYHCSWHWSCRNYFYWFRLALANIRPVFSCHSLKFFCSLRSKRFQSSYCAKVRTDSRRNACYAG